MGFIKIHRSILEHWIITKPTALQVFIWLLLRANYKDSVFVTQKYGELVIKRGQNITGRKKMAEEIGLTEQKIRLALELLSKAQMLTIKTTNKFSVITIVNYNKYQNDETQTTSKRTSKEPTKNQQRTTVKEGIEGEEGKEKDHAAKAAGINTLIAVFCEEWKAVYKRGYDPAGPDYTRIKPLKGTDPVLFRQAVKAYLSGGDDWARKQLHPLYALCTNWNRWATLAVPVKACNHPEEEYIESVVNADGTRYGTCGACGVSYPRGAK